MSEPKAVRNRRWLPYAAVAAGPHRSGIVLTVGVALAGMAFGRIVSALFDGRTAFYPNWFYFGVESVAVLHAANDAASAPRIKVAVPK